MPLTVANTGYQQVAGSFTPLTPNNNPTPSQGTTGDFLPEKASFVNAEICVQCFYN
jgi:hypothetical protein